MKFLRKNPKHEVVILYKDRVVKREVDYPKDGILRLEDGTAYYLDPSKTFHIFVHGYVNEIDGAKVHKEVDPHDVHKVVQQLEFEPSYTFLNAYDSKVIRDFLKKADETTFDDMILYAMVGVLIILAFLVWNMNTKLVELMEYVGIELLGGVL
jgi:hypothetical protein